MSSRLIVPAMCMLHLLAAASVVSAETFTARTKHYEVVTERSAEYSRSIAERMELILEKGYRELVKLRTRAGIRMRIRVFRNRELYRAYCRDRKLKKIPPSFLYLHTAPWHPDNLAIGFEIDDVPLFERLYHEGWHQYLRNAVHEPPQWLNEGFANYFKAFKAGEDGDLMPGVELGMYRRLREGLLDLDSGPLNGKYTRQKLYDLAAMSKSEWQRESASNYALSWGLCCLLVESKERAYRDALKKVMRSLKADVSRDRNTAAAAKALRKTLKSDRLESDFEAWARELAPVGQREFAEGLKCLTTSGTKRAVPLLEKSTSLAPHNFRAWYYLGYARYERREYGPAVEALKRATDLFPEYVPAFARQAQALEKLERWEEALAAARRGIRILEISKKDGLAEDPNMSRLLQKLVGRLEKKAGAGEGDE